MTATTVSTGAAAQRPASPGRIVRFGSLIAAEWTKFWAVPSTYWILLATAIPCVLAGLLSAQHDMSNWLGPQGGRKLDAATFDALAISFNGFSIGQLAIGSLGVIVIGSEYTSGLIRTTLAAVPQRGSVLGAKATVVALVALPGGLLLAVAAFLPVQMILHQHNLGVSLRSPDGLRAVGAMGIYIAVIGLVGLAFGAIIRHTAGAFAAVFGLIFVLPGVVATLPAPWASQIGRFLPHDLFEQLSSQHLHADLLSRWWSFTVLIAYPVVLLTVAACLLRRRDV